LTVSPTKQRKGSPRASPKPRSSPRLQQENGLRATAINLANNPTLAMTTAQLQNTVTTAMSHPLQLAPGAAVPVVSLYVYVKYRFIGN
jgi:hypothetical protein